MPEIIISSSALINFSPNENATALMDPVAPLVNMISFEDLA